MFKNNIRNLIFCGLMIALVFITTFAIKIPVPFTQGYIHAGDSMIFLTALLFGWKYGALAGGLGSFFADMMGYPHWALPTLLIKSIMGALVGYIGYDLRKEKKLSAFISILLAGVWFSAIYFIKKLVANFVEFNSEKLVGDLDATESIADVLALTEKLQSQLLVLGLVLFFLVLALAFYLTRLDRDLFSLNQLLGMLIAGLWMVFGYYLAASLIYGNFIVPAFSIPWNILQFVGGGAIAFLILIALKKTNFLKNLNLNK